MKKTVSFSIIALIGLVAIAATMKISDYPAKTYLTGTELFLLADGSTNAKMTATSLNAALTNVAGLRAGSTIRSTSGSALTNIYHENVVAWNPSKTYLIAEGDSLTAGSTWFSVLTNMTAWSSFAFVTNAATGGDEVASMTNQWPTEIAPHSPGSGTNALFFMWAGANDLHHDPYVTWYQLSNELSWARSSNMTVVAFTLTPRSFNDAQMWTNMYVINGLIRSSTNWDYLIDTAAIFPNNWDATFYNADGTHLNSHGYSRLAQSVDAVLRGPKRNSLTHTDSYGTNQIWFSPAGAELVRMNAAEVTVSTVVTSTVSMGAPTLYGYRLMAGGGNAAMTLVNNAVAYSPLFGGAFVSGTDANVCQAVPFACTAKNLNVRFKSTIGSGTNVVAALYTNGVISNLQITFNANGGGSYVTTDSTHSVPLAAGDTVSIGTYGDNPSASAGLRCNWSLEFSVP